MKEREESHWDCPFFRHCWNEGLKLPARNNCPECSEQYHGYRQARVNRRPIQERLGARFPEDDRRLKNEDSKPHVSKRIADQAWADVEDSDDDLDSPQEYVWQKGQWCPPGLRKSQKRRVQHLRNRELKEATAERKQVWRPKKKTQEASHSAEEYSASGRSADVSMVFYIPIEFAAPTEQATLDPEGEDVLFR